jgi:cell wall assembly regulator SMI1
MKIIWERIHDWLAVNAPQVLENLRPGANDEEIYRAEAFFGVEFPEDFKLSYRVHDGQEEECCSLFPYLEFLSLQNVIKISEKWQNYSDDNFRCDPEYIFEGIWNGWWNPNWIPFTNESNGACQCVDLAPGVIFTNSKKYPLDFAVETKWQNFLDHTVVVCLQLWCCADFLLQHGNPLLKGLQGKFHNILLRADIETYP